MSLLYFLKAQSCIKYIAKLQFIDKTSPLLFLRNITLKTVFGKEKVFASQGKSLAGAVELKDWLGIREKSKEDTPGLDIVDRTDLSTITVSQNITNSSNGIFK